MQIFATKFKQWKKAYLVYQEHKASTYSYHSITKMNIIEVKRKQWLKIGLFAWTTVSSSYRGFHSILYIKWNALVSGEMNLQKRRKKKQQNAYYQIKWCIYMVERGCLVCTSGPKWMLSKIAFNTVAWIMAATDSLILYHDRNMCHVCDTYSLNTVNLRKIQKNDNKNNDNNAK